MPKNSDLSNITHYSPEDLAVNPTLVARYFGGTRYSPDDRTRKRISAAIKLAYGLIWPTAAMALCPVRETLFNGDVILENGRVLTGVTTPHGPENVYLAAVVATLGNGLESICQKLSADGNIYEATLMNGVGVALLDRLGEVVWHELGRQAADLDLFCGCRLGPGLNDFPVSAQRLIFDLVDVSAIDVSLGGGLMMTPVKSISFLMPLVPEPGRLTSAKCHECALEDCQFRCGLTAHDDVVFKKRTSC